MEGPIPPPLPDDEEDVSWALSTASALWGRGERAEGLKWLRRAAEHASDLNADTRALHLFKAAADISVKLSTPPPASQPAASSPPATPGAAARSAMANATLPSALAKQLGEKLKSTIDPANRLPQPKPALTPRPLQPAANPAVRVTHARTIQSAEIPDVDGLETTIRREPVALRQSVPMGRSVPIPPPPRSSDRGLSFRPQVPASEARKVPEPRPSEPKPEPKPVLGRRRGTDSGRKKTFDERLKRDASTALGAPSRVRVAAKNERFLPDDEVTQTRSAASLANLTGKGAKYDDLDEDTRVLSGKSADSVMTPSIEAELDDAVEKLEDQAANADESPLEITATEAPDDDEDEDEEALKTEVGFAWSPESYDGPIDPTSGAPQAKQPRARNEPRDGRAAASVAVPSTERMVPLPVLSAVRVAVLAGASPGEARLVVLDGVATPPAGAIHAVLLPLTSADGAAILRLLGG